MLHVVDNVLDHILELAKLNLHRLQLLGLGNLYVIDRLRSNVKVDIDRARVARVGLVSCYLLIPLQIEGNRYMKQGLKE